MSDVALQQQWTVCETERLNRAVAKIVKLGEQVGLMPEDMIALLDSGCSVGELLMVLASKRAGAA